MSKETFELFMSVLGVLFCVAFSWAFLGGLVAIALAGFRFTAHLLGL